MGKESLGLEQHRKHSFCALLILLRNYLSVGDVICLVLDLPS